MERDTILLVDDEKEIVELLEIYFRNEGYRLLKAFDGREALDLLRREKVDLIILDVMMPRMDGLEACMKIREERRMPIIMLSAKGGDLDKIGGLSIGADDYVAKPFNPLEVLARVKSQLRRYHVLGGELREKVAEGELVCDDLIVSPVNHEVTVQGRPVKLTPREFAIVELLARHPGQVFNVEQIYTRVWGEPPMDNGNTVMVHIRNIREKIEVDSRKPRYLHTVWGIGYKLDRMN
ncbi:response regulator transcription factor [Paenibacillus sp. HN-1]|uniref:response regulator transcription factor n=1 Tax=Paenibacillus TaxID=44249 RepID=UPI001CA918BB|nr:MULTISPECIES: response regulator transcription factor [Paenibacillus]MBY9077319.1 response regulator transcription factor [Paenibacillus sp. CGMCC 1.18879]MBY9085639.1 response regulator transcription factor [Paenibacillus sinensis]